MPAPTAYTENELAAFLITTLGKVATALEWTAATTQVVEAVYDTIHAYGVSVIADATDVRKLRALARVAIWRAVVRDTAGHYAVAAEGMSFNRQQLHEQATRALREAEGEAAEIGAGVAALLVTPVTHVHDPYAYQPDELRTVP